MIGKASRLAEVTVRGLVHHHTGEARPRQVTVALLHADTGPALFIAGAAPGTDGYEVPVAVLREALTALPLRELFRVIREARP